MKTILLALLIPVLAIIVRRKASFFNGLDFLSTNYDITWDDITEEMCP